MSFGWEGDVQTLCDEERWVELRQLVREKLNEHGIIVITGVPASPAIVRDIMLTFGNDKDESVTNWTGTPCDPDDDGVPGALDAIVPGFPCFRLLGNTVDAETKKPTALLARTLGYYWHQDSVGSTSQNSGASHKCVTGLFCELTPECGAETLFASCEQLWTRLTPDQQRFLECARGVFSNQTTAGGPAAFDSEFGNLRLNSTGTMRIRDATRRRQSWSENRHIAQLYTFSRDRRTKLLTACQVRNLDYIEGMESKASREAIDAILRHALGVEREGRVDPETLTTVSATAFSPDVVKAIQWRPGMLAIFDNSSFIHSPTPTNLYTGRGIRRMWQMIVKRNENAAGINGALASDT